MHLLLYILRETRSQYKLSKLVKEMNETLYKPSKIWHNAN